jgi:hypothetical protein
MHTHDGYAPHSHEIRPDHLGVHHLMPAHSVPDPKPGWVSKGWQHIGAVDQREPGIGRQPYDAADPSDRDICPRCGMIYPEAQLCDSCSGADLATALLREALHIRMYGEFAPGGRENWHDWDRKAEHFLRGLEATEIRDHIRRADEGDEDPVVEWERGLAESMEPDPVSSWVPMQGDTHQHRGGLVDREHAHSGGSVPHGHDARGFQVWADDPERAYHERHDSEPRDVDEAGFEAGVGNWSGGSNVTAAREASPDHEAWWKDANPGLGLNVSRESFEAAYAAASGVTTDWLHEHGRRAVPCQCGDSICVGWQMARRVHG